jgi:hypothetical protein
MWTVMMTVDDVSAPGWCSSVLRRRDAEATLVTRRIEAIALRGLSLMRRERRNHGAIEALRGQGAGQAECGLESTLVAQVWWRRAPERLSPA